MSVANVERKSVVSACRVPERSRCAAMVRFLGVRSNQVESAIYRALGSLCEKYSGGYWEMMYLSNGGFFMHPVSQPRWQLRQALNYSEAAVSAETAGIVACLYAFSHLSADPQYAALANRYHELREYALDHAEAAAIFALID